MLEPPRAGTPSASDSSGAAQPRPRERDAAPSSLRAAPNRAGGSSGESFDQSGLGLRGVGEGGGGKGGGGKGTASAEPQRKSSEGTGLGSRGSRGSGDAAAPQGMGAEAGSGRLGGSHKVSVPRVRMGATFVSGRMPPEVIQRVVRQSFGRFRACYERGLMRNPELQGRVAVRFIIRSDGSVAAVANGGSDLPDAEVVGCVVRSFFALSFPAPESAHVTVLYPILFSSDGSRPSRPPSPWPDPSLAAALRREAMWPGETVSSGPTARHVAANDAWALAGEPALEKLREAVEASGSSRTKHEAWILGLLVRGRFQRALTAAERFTELDPDLPRARELYAYAKAATGDGEGAVRALDALVEASPRRAAAHERAARAFEAAGDERRACAHWRSLAELRDSAEALHEALRCRARAWGDRDAVLEEMKSTATAAPPSLLKALAAPRQAGGEPSVLAKLLARFEAGESPAFDGSTARPGQFEAKITCADGVERCPTLLVVAPNGAVHAPWIPTATRSSVGSISFSGLQNGTYRTLVVGGAADARAEIEVRALGTVKKFSIHQGGLQTVVATTVSHLSEAG